MGHIISLPRRSEPHLSGLQRLFQAPFREIFFAYVWELAEEKKDKKGTSLLSILSIVYEHLHISACISTNYVVTPVVLMSLGEILLPTPTAVPGIGEGVGLMVDMASQPTTWPVNLQGLGHKNSSCQCYSLMLIHAIFIYVYPCFMSFLSDKENSCRGMIDWWLVHLFRELWAGDIDYIWHWQLRSQSSSPMILSIVWPDASALVRLDLLLVMLPDVACIRFYPCT